MKTTKYYIEGLKTTLEQLYPGAPKRVSLDGVKAIAEVDLTDSQLNILREDIALTAYTLEEVHVYLDEHFDEWAIAAAGDSEG